MTAKKTTKTETIQLPDTLAELVAEYPELTGLPELTPANKFDVTQSTDFTVLLTLFDEEIPKVTKNDDPVESALSLARINATANEFYQTIAVDKDAYTGWGTGRDGNALFSAFLALTMFYRNELGKSEASKRPTGEAPSN